MRARRPNRTKDFEPPDIGANQGNPSPYTRAEKSARAGADAMEEDGDDVNDDGGGVDGLEERDSKGTVALSDDDYDDDGEDDEVAALDESAAGSPAGGATVAASGGGDDAAHQILPYPIRSRLLTRVYTGPLRGRTLFGVLRDLMYGPDYDSISLAWSLLDRWAFFPVLPPALPPRDSEGLLPSPWLPAGFEATVETAARRWYRGYLASSPALQQSRPLSKEDTRPFTPEDDDSDLAVLLGPWDRQKEYRLRRGSSLSLGPSNIPLDDQTDVPEDRKPSGWVFDVGGLVVALDWAPLGGQGEQVLGLAVVPHSDQEERDGEGIRPPSDEAGQVSALENSKGGNVQFWGFTATTTATTGIREEGERLSSPSAAKPRLLATLCFDWGRPKRLQWCPVPVATASETYGIVALLCGDGLVRVVEVKAVSSADAPTFDYIENPMATLGTTDEYNVSATCLAWTGPNRLALGHSDGSVTLWSVHPRALLQRQAVHASFVLDMSAAWPSHPYLVATTPVSGCTSLTDLAQPAAESTYVAAPSVAFQPGLVRWAEPMQGWLVLAPSTGPGAATSATFLHARAFCQPRTVAALASPLVCLAASAAHPYVLAGCADGSLWSLHALARLFKLKDEPTYKIKLCEHEFRPARRERGQEVLDQPPSPPRGAARFLHGFSAEVNGDSKRDRGNGPMHGNRNKKAAGSGTRGGNRSRRKTPSSGKKRGWSMSLEDGATPELGDDDDNDDYGDDNYDDDEENDDEAEVQDADGLTHLTYRFTLHDPRTRATAVAWNPNVEFGCWAAAAFGSGLVRVMDLGVE